MGLKTRVITVDAANRQMRAGFVRFFTQASLYLAEAYQSYDRRCAFALTVPGPSYLWTEGYLFELAQAMLGRLDENRFQGLWWQDQTGGPFHWHPWRTIGFIDDTEARLVDNALGQTKRRRSGVWKAGATGERNRLKLRIPHL